MTPDSPQIASEDEARREQEDEQHERLERLRAAVRLWDYSPDKPLDVTLARVCLSLESRIEELTKRMENDRTVRAQEDALLWDAIANPPIPVAPDPSSLRPEEAGWGIWADALRAAVDGYEETDSGTIQRSAMWDRVVPRAS